MIGGIFFLNLAQMQLQVEVLPRYGDENQNRSKALVRSWNSLPDFV